MTVRNLYPVVAAEDDGWTAVRAAVYLRDGGCLAVQRAKIGSDVAPDECRDRWGIGIRYDRLELLELDHVKQQPAVGAPIQRRTDRHSYKAPDDTAHLVAICPYHHANWATAHRSAERGYLAQRYPQVWS